MNLLLISGHGAGDPGVTAAINGRAYREADEARKVTAALREALEGSCGVTVYPTDRNIRGLQKGDAVGSRPVPPI